LAAVFLDSKRPGRQHKMGEAEPGRKSGESRAVYVAKGGGGARDGHRRRAFWGKAGHSPFGPNGCFHPLAQNGTPKPGPYDGEDEGMGLCGGVTSAQSTVRALRLGAFGDRAGISAVAHRAGLWREGATTSPRARVAPPRLRSALCAVWAPATRSGNCALISRALSEARQSLALLLRRAFNSGGLWGASIMVARLRA